MVEASESAAPDVEARKREALTLAHECAVHAHETIAALSRFAARQKDLSEDGQLTAAELELLEQVRPSRRSSATRLAVAASSWSVSFTDRHEVGPARGARALAGALRVTIGDRGRDHVLRGRATGEPTGDRPTVLAMMDLVADEATGTVRPRHPDRWELRV